MRYTMQRMTITGTAQHNVSRVVRLLMTDLSITSDTLAEALDVSPEAIRSKRTGRRAWSLDEVCALAAVFDLPVTAFLGEPDWAVLRHARFAGEVNSDLDHEHQIRLKIAQRTGRPYPFLDPELVTLGDFELVNAA